MMYEELVEKLRDDNACLSISVLHEAADAIEELQKRVPKAPHGRLIDADALMKDGWVLQKQVMRMGGYAIHEMPLTNPSIAVIIPAEEGEA